MAHLANGTATHQLTSRPKLFGTALLAARLHHTAVLAAGIHHRPPLGNGQGKGLFAIHILPRLASVHRLQRVPMVGCGDQHRVHIFAVQQLAIVNRLNRGATMGLFNH